jgi:hypothetical protein
MEHPFTVFESIGFGLVVFGTASFIAALLVCAGYGFLTFKRQWQRGASLEKDR